MIIRWALSESQYCNVEVNEWFPAEMDRQRLLDLLEVGRPKLCMLSKQEKVDAWLLCSLVISWGMRTQDSAPNF